MSPKCKWCGLPLEKEHNRQQYHKGECQENAERYNTMLRMRRHRKKYNITTFPLGSSGLRLGKHRRENFKEELFIVEKEIKRLKLRR